MARHPRAGETRRNILDAIERAAEERRFWTDSEENYQRLLLLDEFRNSVARNLEHHFNSKGRFYRWLHYHQFCVARMYAFGMTTSPSPIPKRGRRMIPRDDCGREL